MTEAHETHNSGDRSQVSFVAIATNTHIHQTPFNEDDETTKTPSKQRKHATFARRICYASNEDCNKKKIRRKSRGRPD